MFMNQAQSIINEVKKAFIGKDDIITHVMMAILAKGHVLLEDIPGVGKTTLALSFSRALGLDYKRMQFTPDVLPSDVTGFSMLNQKTGVLEYQPGVALCNLLLADEINRATSRTQAALLECMEEGQITVDGVTHQIPKPFVVIATQNPIGAHGTQLLPDSQMDRFLIRLSIGYPAPLDEISILKSKQSAPSVGEIKQVSGAAEIIAMQDEVLAIYISDTIYDYMIRLVNATRTHSLILQGGSPRASLALMRLGQATAYIDGRDYVVPDDVKNIFSAALGHRLILSPKARVENVTVDDLLQEILETIAAPRVWTKANA